jgi:hypothetical protein
MLLFATEHSVKMTAIFENGWFILSVYNFIDFTVW